MNARVVDTASQAEKIHLETLAGWPGPEARLGREFYATTDANCVGRLRQFAFRL